jgi:hypothetical protein
MWIVCGCPRSGTSLMMDLMRVTFGEDRILGKKFPQEEHIEEMKEQGENESDYQYAARMYVQSRLRNEEEILKDLEESKDMNPNGFWEMLYTVQGVHYRFFDAERMEKLLEEKEKSICKIVSQGLAGSDPRFIDKVVYMIRHPRAVAKSQERLKRQFPMNEIPMIDGEEIKIHTPEMYINVTAMAARYFMQYPDIPVHFVLFDELLAEPERVLKGVGEFLGEGDFTKAIAQINPKYNRSLPQDIESPFWENAEFIYDRFLEKDYEGIIEYMKDPNLMIYRKNRKWYCIRMNRPVVENECLNCISNPTTRENFKKAAESKKINWRAEPCIYECAYSDTETHVSIEESIVNNSWCNDQFDVDDESVKFEDVEVPIELFEKMITYGK